MTKSREIALWAALASFFGSLLAIGAIDILDPARAVQYLSALIVAAITAGAVYARERLNAAKSRRNGE
jgi:drug/metabolite transporter (DMT)-like permease